MEQQHPPATSIHDLGEFGLIDRMKSVLGEPHDENILADIEDDAAVYRVSEGNVHVATTDALIEGVHFDRLLTPMNYLGAKAISVNVSDITAMNARPRYALISLGLPNSTYVEAVEAFYEGIKQACEAYGVTVIGGDTTAARRITISITVIGEAEEDVVVYRRGAQPGDALCVTGDLGGAYAGLKVLLDQRESLQHQGEAYTPDLERFQYVIQRQLAPTARLSTVLDWNERGTRPNALIDISDGLASEVHHLCEQSQCGALVHASALPLNVQTREVADKFGEEVDTYALYGGEDYELLFALPEAELDRLEPGSFNIIGTCKEASAGVQLRTTEDDTVPLEAQGFTHFDEAS